jgi:hypothetical protein
LVVLGGYNRCEEVRYWSSRLVSSCWSEGQREVQCQRHVLWKSRRRRLVLVRAQWVLGMSGSFALLRLGWSSLVVGCRTCCRRLAGQREERGTQLDQQVVPDSR